ncbi:MAG: hypothetical protein E3J70_04595 [Candidatus Heimdallarchaeota archaeon]|nr:MAG: hypothetical protein E3J70_04595 [Candidatus Heimdallarchaeota archaeon]
MAKEAELKKIYLERLRNAGYNTIPELVEILPPTIMNILDSSISTAESLFVTALKAHMKNIQEQFQGDNPEGINKALTDLGYMTIHEIAEANPSIIAKALKINLADAGDLVLFAMELSVVQDKIERRNGKVSIDALDTEISHYLGQLDRLEQDKKLKVLVDESVQKIHDTIKLPSEELKIVEEQKAEIKKILEQFTTVFPACTGFAMYNKRGEGIYNYIVDNNAKETLANIHNTLPSLFWKISLVLEERNDYGWVNAQPHLVWIEAIRDRSMKRQLSYIGLFVFEAESQDGVGTATPTIKGIIKEIERIIYGSVMKS